MVLATPVTRTLNVLVWALPLVVAAGITAPFDRYFLSNFAFLVLPQAVVLFVVMYFELRQPELATTAASLAVLPLLCIVIASRMHGQWWVAHLIALPGFLVGAIATLLWTRRVAASAKSILVSFFAPLCCAALGMLLVIALQRP